VSKQRKIESSPKLSLEDLVGKNVETIARIEQISHDSRTKTDIISDIIASFCGKPVFVYVHLIWFGAWLIYNSLHTVPKNAKFDPPPFNILTLVVSLEAIFLSAFILISQNRQQKIADQRNHLDLQINLLAEQESSQLLVMMKQVMDHLSIASDHNAEALQEATDPELLAKQIGESLDHIKNIVTSPDQDL
jgi:uncharacterized membrane protein